MPAECQVVGRGSLGGAAGTSTGGLIWIIENQLGRRNLQPFTRTNLALQLEPLIAAKAKKNQIRKPESVLQKSAEQKPIDTREEVAKIADVSHDTVAKVKIINKAIRVTSQVRRLVSAVRAAVGVKNF